MMTVIKDGFVGSLPRCGDSVKHRLSAIGTYFRNGIGKKLHTSPGGAGIRTPDLPIAKRNRTRLSTTLGKLCSFIN
jgi:hypothetical protein